MYGKSFSKQHLALGRTGVIVDRRVYSPPAVAEFDVLELVLLYPLSHLASLVVRRLTHGCLEDGSAGMLSCGLPGFDADWVIL